MIKQGYDLTGKALSEKEIQNQIREALSYSCKVWNITTGTFRVAGRPPRYIRTFPRGTPDLMGFRKSDGKMFMIEVKTAKGKLSKEQKEFAEYIKDYPILYGVARSVEDALKIVKGE